MLVPTTQVRVISLLDSTLIALVDGWFPVPGHAREPGTDGSTGRPLAPIHRVGRQRSSCQVSWHSPCRPLRRGGPLGDRPGGR